MTTNISANDFNHSTGAGKFNATVAINLVAALQLAGAGIPIFPARVYQNPGSDKWQKSPIVSGWQKVATTDPEQIRRWWAENPNAVAGIELGRAGLVVIDADRHDGPDGVAAFQALVEANGLPSGPVTVTAGNGQHYYFRQPGDQKLGNRSGALPEGIDVKGAGGWVVAPGSVRPDGAIWQPADGSPSLTDSFPDEIPILPTWLADLIRKVPNAAVGGISGSMSRRAFAKAQLQRSVAEVAEATSGTRNDVLNAKAYGMATFIAIGSLERAEVARELIQACYINGLVTADGMTAVQKTIESGLSAGMAKAKLSANDNQRGGGGAGGRKPNQADALITLAEAAELFHAPDHKGYADLDVDGHRETWPIRSKQFQWWLRRLS